jgi:hypothetical protein
MTFAPPAILAVRKLIQRHVPQLSAVELGIVGSVSHANSGTSYHLGKGALKSSAYSVVESSRDRNGLSEAASGLDIGWFKITVKGKTHTLRDLSVWMVGQCRAGAAGAGDIREIIYSADGKTVKRWDRLGRRSTGDDSHLTHTHVSWHRDSEHRDKTALFTRWFQHIGAIDTPEDDVTEAEIIAAVTKALKAADGQGALSRAAGIGVHGQVIGRSTTTMGQALQSIAGLTAKLTAVEATLNAVAARPGGAPTVAELTEALRAVLREGTGE